jgi:hypothetical protein
VLDPSLAALLPAIGPGRDALQAYCDVLEEKWILSELAGTDVGLRAAIDAYLGLGAPAPETDPNAGGSRVALDLDLDDETLVDEAILDDEAEAEDEWEGGDR